MRVYISIDIEGIACVVTRKDAWSDGNNYALARRLMTGEANAVIEGAFAGGATEVVIADSHGPMDNLIPEDLHEDVWVIRGQNRAGCMLEGIEAGDFDALMLVGYHAMAGTWGGNLAHSFSGDVAEMRLNGVVVGEMGFGAAYAGHFGVPLALVSGDDKLAAEVEALTPWAERVVLKHGINLIAARSMTPKKARKVLRERAQHAVERARAGALRPLTFDAPLRLDVRFKNTDHANRTMVIPGVTRVDGCTLTYTGADMVEINRAWMAMMRLA